MRRAWMSCPRTPASTCWSWKRFLAAVSLRLVWARTATRPSWSATSSTKT